jgi:hypothetical protein
MPGGHNNGTDRRRGYASETMSDTEDSQPADSAEPVPAAEPAPEPIEAEPDPGAIPLQSLTASDEPDPGPITVEEEWRSLLGRETEND